MDEYGNADEERQLEQQVRQLEAFVRPHLSPKALQRLGALKTAHPDKAVQVLLILGQLIQGGKAKTVDDDQLRDLLLHMQPSRRGFTIKRK